MKQFFLCAGILLLVSMDTWSQTRPKKLKAKQHRAVTTTAGTPNSSHINSFTVTNSYLAKANSNSVSSLKNNYPITDPILTTLNARADGAHIKFNNSGIVGMPKRAYGFANGHVILSTTGAVTSGTQTGSGAVGTGTSQATFGSIGAPMNVNGKSPYAGINMWGNAMNMNSIRMDSSVRFTPLKKRWGP